MVNPSACFTPGERGPFSPGRPAYAQPIMTTESQRRGSGGYASPYEPRYTPTMEADDSPRKRISIACGRCRKRKIRCSGDDGHGGPCSNCRSAGHAPCQFLRVKSHEADFRDHSSNFQYNLDPSRQYHATQRAPAISGPPLLPVTQSHVPILHGPYAHESVVFMPPAPSCSYGGSVVMSRPYSNWGPPPYGPGTTDHHGHHLPPPSSYPPPEDIKYYDAPQTSSARSSYGDLASAYGTGSSASTLVHRPASAVIGRGLPHYVGAGVPSADTGNKIPMLPNGRTPLPTGTQLYPRNDSISSAAYSKGSSSPALSLPELTPTSSYASYEASPILSYPPSTSTHPCREPYSTVIAAPTPIAPISQEYRPLDTLNSYQYTDTATAAALAAFVPRHDQMPNNLHSNSAYLGNSSSYLALDEVVDNERSPRAKIRA